ASSWHGRSSRHDDAGPPDALHPRRPLRGVAGSRRARAAARRGALRAAPRRYARRRPDARRAARRADRARCPRLVRRGRRHRPGRRVHAFCLRAVAESLPRVAALAPVSAGVAAAGRILDDVSFINASGLVHRGAIRRTGQASLAFFERPEWMEAWFPGYAEAIVTLCRELHEVVEAPRADRAPRTRRGSPAPSAPPESHPSGSSARRSAPGR